MEKEKKKGNLLTFFFGNFLPILYDMMKIVINIAVLISTGKHGEKEVVEWKEVFFLDFFAKKKKVSLSSDFSFFTIIIIVWSLLMQILVWKLALCK